MFKDDLEKRYLTFKFPGTIDKSQVRFALYNEKEKVFPIIANLNSPEDYIKVDTLSLNPHYQYKYKYQVRENGKWITAREYKYLNIDFQDKNNVKYRFYREEKSKYLLVCFSGNGSAPAFNYIGAFSNLKVNKLFIKDDFSEHTSNRSVFYVGKNRKNEVMGHISNLINRIRDEINVDKENVICCGTSKGGYAAVLYALTYGYGYGVVGSPTLFLGNSLLVEGKLKDHARVISGNTDEESVDWLNNILLSKISNSMPCEINVIIGTGERRYEKHLLPFVTLAEQNKDIKFNITTGDFSEHNKIATLYPPYARNIIENIINNN